VDAADGDNPVADLAHIVEATPPFRELFVEIAHPLFDPRVTSVWLADDG
jgi:hypothetical protein